eukprot:g849.t1
MLPVILCVQLSSTLKLCVSAGSVTAFGNNSWNAKHVAIVNAANRRGLGGGGVDGAISTAGGENLRQDRKALPVLEGTHSDRIRTGGAVITGPNNYDKLYGNFVVHAVGPNYRVLKGLGKSLEDGDELLKSAYVSAMAASQANGIKYIGFSLISAGIFRGPRTLKQVLQIGIEGIKSATYEGLEEVHLVAYNKKEQDLLVELLQPKKEF